MEDNPESIEFIDDVTETQTKKEKDIHKHNDKIDASNLQSKSFQAVFTLGRNSLHKHFEIII